MTIKIKKSNVLAKYVDSFESWLGKKTVEIACLIQRCLADCVTAGLMRFLRWLTSQKTGFFAQLEYTL